VPAPNPLLVRYDQAAAATSSSNAAESGAKPSGRTPLAMTWFDDPRLIRFDVHAGRSPANGSASPRRRGCAR